MDRARRSTRKRLEREYDGDSSDGETPISTTPAPTAAITTAGNVNLNHMNIESLKKYKRVYKLRTRANNTSKSEMVSLVQKHFQTMPVPDEAETIETFIYNIKYAQ